MIFKYQESNPIGPGAEPVDFISLDDKYIILDISLLILAVREDFKKYLRKRKHMFIKTYIDGLQEDGAIGAEVAKILGISEAMVSSYKNQGYNPSLNVAKKVYLLEGIVLHPFSEEGLKFEVRKYKKEIE